VNLPVATTPSPSHVCTMLRTKTAFGSYMLETDDDDSASAGGTGVGWRDGSSTTAAYWCLRTMETCGPDDSPAHGRTCRSDAGRRCFCADED
jgi:hypothetical protein